MNLFGTGAAGVLGSGSTPWLLISLGVGLVVLGMWCRKKFFPRHVGAGDGQRPHRILPGFPRRDDLRGKDRVAGRGVIPFRAHATLQPRPGDGEKEGTSKEEESAMRTPERMYRKARYLLLTLTISAALAACGGGGGAPVRRLPGWPGPATVDVSIAAADVGSSAPAVTVSGSDSVPSTDPGYRGRSRSRSSTRNQARLHGGDQGFPDALEAAFGSEDLDGDIQAGSSPGPASPPDKPNFLTVEPEPPVWIDLIQLDNGKKLARLLNKFDQVPTGTYYKIRVYYGKVKVVVGTAPPPCCSTPRRTRSSTSISGRGTSS